MEEISFPRGGRTSSTAKAKDNSKSTTEEKKRKERPSEIKKKRKAEKESPDFLFGSKSTSESTSTTKSKKAKKDHVEDVVTTTTTKQSLLPLGGGGVYIPQHSNNKDNNSKKDGKRGTAPIIEAISFQKLTKGTKLLGYVREVQDEFAVICLPNLLTGFMLLSPSEKNSGKVTTLKQCLSVGQILNVAVQKVTREQLPGGATKKRIQVSALPTHVNPRDALSDNNNNKNSISTTTSSIRGQILSVEDHGCLVDLGMGRRGFLKFDQVEGDYVLLDVDETNEGVDTDTKRRILQSGRLYDFTIINNSKVSDKKDETSATSILPLKLQKDSTQSQQMIMPQATTTTTPGGSHRQNSQNGGPAYTLSSLQPGMMVTAKVEAIAKNGLCVTFLGNVFRGAIELGSHLGGHELGVVAAGSDETKVIGGGNLKQDLENAWRKIFDQHQHFPARIIAVDVPSKMIRLSIAPHILTMRPPPKVDVGVGTIVEECTVVRVDQGIGALLALPKEYHLTSENLLPKRLVKKSDLFQNEAFQKSMTIPGVYVHISKAYDDEQDGKKGKKKTKSDSLHEVNVGKFHKDFGLGSKHSVRILNTGHWVDGVASGGCSPAVLQAHVLTHADLQPGQVYKQVPVCAKLTGGSVLVNLGGSAGNPIRGLIPSPLHLLDNPGKSTSDFRKKMLETKFDVDAKVDVRVLWVNETQKRCVVTAKKSLVKMDEDHVVTTYEMLDVGKIATGFISKVDDLGLYVTFCGRVYGRVTAKSLAFELGIENHRENYQVGDVVTCRVVKVTKNQGKRRRTLEDDHEEDDSDDEMETDEPDIQAFYQIFLSLKVQGDTNDEDAEDEEGRKEDLTESSEPKRIHVRAGAILPEKSLKIVELFKGKVRGSGYVPGYAIVSIKSKHLVDKADEASMLPQMECKLPFDQLLDDYEPTDIENHEALDALAARTLRVGKKINQKAIVLTDPRKSNVDHSSGIGRLTVVSLRKGLIAAIEGAKENDAESIVLPSPSTNLFVGALVKGYVAQIDPRHGAFLRFLDGMTGLIPRMNNGLDLMPYSTIVAKVQVIDDTVRPYRIMLQPTTGTTRKITDTPFKVGDKIAKARVTFVDSLEAKLDVVGNPEADLGHASIRLHVSMKAAKDTTIKLRKTKNGKEQIAVGHPFFGLNPEDELKNLIVVSVSRMNGKVVVQVTDREMKDEEKTVDGSSLVCSRSQCKAGMTVSAVVSQVHAKNKGVSVWISPSVKGFIPGLELSTDVKVLNAISSHVSVGAKLTCVIMDDSQWHENRAKVPFASRTQKSWLERKSTPSEKRELYLSVLAVKEPTLALAKPIRNDLIIGRVNKQLPQYMGPSLMMSLRGGFLARCCITELAEFDDWANMPLGNMSVLEKESSKEQTSNSDVGDQMDEESVESDDASQTGQESDDPFGDGRYVQCRVLKSIPKQSLVEVSLRESRIEGDLDEDQAPPEGETVQAYVVETNKKGCFVRLARHIDGRATLTELCDGFLPNPQASFPAGRLVVGKVKSISTIPKSKSSKHPAKMNVDLDMRESVLLGNKRALDFDEVKVNEKYKGTVTRVEAYGVFVQLENSKVSGLVHLSECSDGFVKNVASLYDPGDLVKVLVIKKDDAEKKIGFSMKASHFADDEDSDDDSSADDDGDVDDNENDSDDNDMVDNGMDDDEMADADSDLDSEDENFASKLAAKMAKEGDLDDTEDGESSGSEDDSDNESESEEEEEETPKMDVDVGFDWDYDGKEKPKSKGSDSESSDDSDSEEENENEKGHSHNSRKKQALRRQEEREISKRETALADGTADENPETAGDFERLLAASPNSSELWIRYMAFHLSVADIASARAVAEKAIGRIEFREEREKLNVWTALLTVENKYGTEASFATTIERACGQNNPKQVYLRACEIMEKDLTTAESVTKADALYQKMCAKFKSKKKVWLAYLTYLLKQSRNEEAHALSKRALLSLAPYKHAETMSKFAQLEYEFGRPERARTLFDGIVAKYPKRLDLFYVYVDKEIKFGTFTVARSLLQNKVNGAKLSDKQVKGLFKKWFHIEEQHGDEASKEHVKECARQYVQKASNAD